MVVLHARTHLLHLVQFMVMRGEKRLGMRRRVVVQVFDHGPRNRNTVIGARTAADFVQQHDAAVGNVIEDAGRLEHFDHKGRLALRNIVRGSHPRENFVHDTDVRERAGTYEPICAMRIINAVCRSRADLPDILGPVIIIICCSLSSSITSLGTYSSPTGIRVSITG